MSESQTLSVIRVWCALAWADGVVVESERQAMSKLIQSADLTDDESAMALAWLDNPVDMDTSSISKLAEGARESIYQAATQLAFVDNDVAESEIAFLRLLQSGLGINESRARELEARMPGFTK